MAVTRTVEVSVPPDEAFQKVRAAMESIGKVEEANPTTRSIVGKARHGLNPVRLRISVLLGAQAGTAVIEIGGKGQDVWGAAPRKVIDRLIAAIV
jgi:hypothetical protein